jgi:hypothetical protein
LKDDLDCKVSSEVSEERKDRIFKKLRALAAKKQTGRVLLVPKSKAPAVKNKLIIINARFNVETQKDRSIATFDFGSSSLSNAKPGSAPAGYAIPQKANFQSNESAKMAIQTSLIPNKSVKQRKLLIKAKTVRTNHGRALNSSKDKIKLTLSNDKMTSKTALKTRHLPMRLAKLPKTPTYLEYHTDSSTEGAVKRAKQRFRKRKISYRKSNDLTCSDDSDDSIIEPVSIQKQLPKVSCTEKGTKKKHAEIPVVGITHDSALNLKPKHTRASFDSTPASPASNSTASTIHDSDNEDDLPLPVPDSRYAKIAESSIPMLYTPSYLTDPDSLENDPDFFGYLAAQTLQVGDVIEFTAVEGTAGVERWNRRAKILGFTTHKPDYPLVLAPMHVLPWSHQVRRVASDLVEASSLRPIDKYVFVGEKGEQNTAAALIEIGKRGHKLKADVEKVANDWWTNKQYAKNSFSARTGNTVESICLSKKQHHDSDVEDMAEQWEC